jgi:hypothetical protein
VKKLFVLFLLINILIAPGAGFESADTHTTGLICVGKDLSADPGIGNERLQPQRSSVDQQKNPRTKVFNDFRITRL